MRVVRKTESLYEVEFDEGDVKKLEDIEDVFEVIPEDVILNSVQESMRLGIAGVHNLVGIIQNKRNKENGN